MSELPTYPMALSARCEEAEDDEDGCAQVDMVLYVGTAEFFRKRLPDGASYFIQERSRETEYLSDALYDLFMGVSRDQ